jgi:hypothetical protein
MQEVELRAYATKAADAFWQSPRGSQVFSYLDDRGSSYVCMTNKGINFWDQGNVTSFSHDPETRARYEDLLKR